MSAALAPVFVVGTGRCGSTMLSEFLRTHPSVLSVSEFFSLITDLGGRIAEAFPAGPIDAAELLAIVAGLHPRQSLMLRHGVAMEEVLYRPGPGRRFTAETGVPAVLQTTLPHLSEDPDRLFDALCEFVRGRPRAPAADHYAALFGWLAERLGKRTWVERSGGSLRIVRRLAAAFPGAKFVHLVRDGRNCAISMSRHLGFRMVLLAAQLTEILGVDPFESPDRAHVDDVPDELEPFLPERFTGEAFLRHETPLPLCGHYWSGEIVAGLRELAELPPGRVLTLRYEEFLRAPAATIARLAAFVDPEVDAGWVAAAAATVRSARSSWRALPERERRRLTDACRPGFAALGELAPED